MKKIDLYTDDGKFVTSVFIPPFKMSPKAILWGARLFFFKDDNIYFEGFWVAAIVIARQTVPKIDQSVSKKSDIVSEPAGNDDLLFGMPNNLDEAVEAYIEFYRTAEDMSNIIEMSEEQFTGSAHHASGQFIRNSWFLWWQTNHKYKEWPVSIPPIVKFFNDLGIVHADDMSSIIISSAYRKVNGRLIDLEGQVKRYQDFWKKQGYEDGKPKIN